MKKIKNIFIIAFLLFIYVYICFIDNIPKNIIVFKDEELKIPNFWGISFYSKENSISTSSNINNNNIGNMNMEVKLFNTFTVKNIDVSVIERSKIIALGQIAGMKLYTNGALVVGMSEIESEDGVKYKPYEKLGIQEGDMIISINGMNIKNSDELIKEVNNIKENNLELTLLRNNETYKVNITPKKAKDKQYKLGIWVRDSAAGIGTMTYYEPSSGKFAALGHGITDIDTGDLVNISSGELVSTDIVSIIKGLKGNPRKDSRNNRK